MIQGDYAGENSETEANTSEDEQAGAMEYLSLNLNNIVTTYLS